MKKRINAIQLALVLASIGLIFSVANMIITSFSTITVITTVLIVILFCVDLYLFLKQKKNGDENLK